jgi:hypothetical protein
MMVLGKGGEEDGAVLVLALAVVTDDEDDKGS